MKTNWRMIVLLSMLLSACSASLPNKRYIDVADVGVNYVKMGQGSPVVILESGFGTPMEIWSDVLPEVARMTTVFAYNRRGFDVEKEEQINENNKIFTAKNLKKAGEVVVDAVAPNASKAVKIIQTVQESAQEGFDDVDIVESGKALLDRAIPDAAQVMEVAGRVKRAFTPDEKRMRTAVEISQELRLLLHATNTRPPYVLVGHSSGGMYALYYARTWPDEVVGIVLVDSSHPEQMTRCRAKYGDECNPPGVVNMALKMLPDELYGEFLGLEETGRQVLAANPLKRLPMVVISHGKTDDNSQPIYQLWPELQADLASMLPESEHIIAQKSGHLIPEDQPDLIVKSITNVLVKLGVKEEVRVSNSRF